MNALLLSALLLPYLAPAKDRPVPTELLPALAANTVSLTAWAAGGLGAGLRCTIQNRTVRPMELRIPAGLHFAPATSPESQDLLTVEVLVVKLLPHAHEQVRLAGYCMEKHDHGPSENLTYRLAGAAPPDLLALGDSLAKYPALAPEYGQMFVWTLTDGEALRPIAVRPALLRAARNVMRLVSERAHRPAAAVTAAVGGRAVSSFRTFSKRAQLLYHNPTPQPVSLKVYDADGHERYTLFQNKALTAGVVQYSFGLNEMVEATGPPPVYFFRLLDAQGKVLQETRMDDATSARPAAPQRLKFTLACTLPKPVNNALVRVRLPDGTLVEEVMTMPHLAAGKVNISSCFHHLLPPGTAFVAQLESPAGKVYATQPVAP